MEREKSSATLSSSSDDNDGDGNKELLCQPTEVKPVNESTVVLSIRDLHSVLEILRKHNFDSTDYFDLGLALRLMYNTIKVIKSCCKGNPHDCLRECLAAWLRKVEVESEGCPPLTWYTLIEALRSIRNNAVADAIDKEKHPACAIFSRFISAEYIKSLPNGIIQLLVGEKLIFPGDADRSMIFTSLKKSVCSDHKNLTKFASILCKSQITVKMGCAIKRDYGQKFGIVIRISSEMIGNLTEKWSDFVKALNKIKEAISTDIDLETLKNSLRLHLLNQPDLKPQIQECGTTTDVLEFIYGQCSLTNIKLLAETIEDTKNEEAIRVMQEYRKSNDTFFETLSLSLCLDEYFSHPPTLQCEEAVFVVDKSIESYTFKNVEKILEAAVGRLSKEVHVSVVTESNSFVIICSFPLTLSESLISAALKNLKILKEKGVIMLTIGYCTVYDYKEDVLYTKERESDEELEDYITSVYASRGVMEQLLVSTSVKLMISEEETSTLNEEMLIARKEAETMKQSLERMEDDKMLNASTRENEILKQNADEMKKLLQKRMKQEPENGTLKELLHIMEKQSVFNQFEKEEQEMSAKEYDEQLIGMEKDIKENIIAGKTERYLTVDQTREVLMSKQIEKFEKVKVVPKEKSPIIFEDDVYTDVTISHPLLIAIVKTRQFSRLKDIRKLGCVYHNRPKATYSRFQQSIGMCYLAGKFVKKLKKRQPELNITESDVICVQVAALCYNLGFGPFSYIFNDWLKTHWKYDSSASAMMFQYMIDNNNLPFEDYLDDYEQDIEFIKELLTGIGGTQARQRRDKIFLYEIVVNRISGLDINRIDYTARDITVILGKGIHFDWKKFINKTRVETCPDGKKHICATDEDVLEMCNGLFVDRRILFKQLYYDLKNRALAAMITRIFMKCGNIKLIRESKDKRLTLIEATEKMKTYARLTDGILDVIKEQVDDEEVQDLIDRLERSKLFIPIGYIAQYRGNENDLKCDIIRWSEVKKEELGVDDIIVDPIRSGYEGAAGQRMYYISSNGIVQKWTDQWQPIPAGALPAPWRVFLNNYKQDKAMDKALVDRVKKGLLEVIERTFDTHGGTYKDITDIDLTPEEVTADSAKASVKLFSQC